MPGRVAEVLAVSALATIATVVIAAPVLSAPSERLFGMAIVGRHHDPFSVIQQFERPITLGVYSQPVTDITGALLARASGAVAAYNWLVLLSFPLSAAAAYMLARYLALSPVGAAVAAIAYAFSPFHLAHAAYHAHIAQTQWLPLYLLALWRCLDVASPAAVALLAAAAMAVTLSNFYGGLIAAVITPIAMVAYCGNERGLTPFFVRQKGSDPVFRRVGITVGALVFIAASLAAYASYAARAVVVDRAAFAFPRAELFRHSATGWSYLVPPVEHPLLGATAQRLWNAAGVRDGLVEQQVSLGWGIIALGLIAVFQWWSCSPKRAPFSSSSERRSGADRPAASLARVPALAVIAVAALVCSLSPEWMLGPFTVLRPSALLYDVVPMFRAYARFGVAVQLMAVLLAGIGVDYLGRAGSKRARVVCLALVTLAAGEYAVAPSTLWRDVLPTTAHRWVTRQPGPMRVLDCAPLNLESESVQWLTGHRVMLLGSSPSDCTEPDLPRKLAATGYTHLIVRRDTADGRWFAARPAPHGLRAVANFNDGQVFVVAARTPAIFTGTMTKFFPREHDSEWTWRWMGKDAAWTVVNTGSQPIAATLSLELSAFHRPREMELRLDGRHVQTLVVEPIRRIYRIDSLIVPQGGHELVFHPVEAPTVVSEAIASGDRRALSFALGTWSWSVRGEPR